MSKDRQAAHSDRRWTFWSVVLLAAVICFSHIHQGSLAVDAIRYAHIARNILTSGDWFNLFDSYTESPYVNKPPLLFWMLAESFAWFGFSTFIAKAPSALFVFVSLLVLFDLGRILYGVRAGVFAVLLLLCTRIFAKDLLDLNVEGIACLGILLLYRAGLASLREERLVSAIAALLGVVLLLQSKPPYLVLVLLPLLCSFLFARRLPGALLGGVFVGCLLGGSWYFASGGSYVQGALENQIGDPMESKYSTPLHQLRWLFHFLINYPLIACFGFLGARRVVKNFWTVRDEERLLFFASLLLIPIIMFIDLRPRYALQPGLALALLGAGDLARRSESFLNITSLQRICWGLSALCIVLFGVFGVKVHRENPFVHILKERPQLLSEHVTLCLDFGEHFRSAPKAKMARLLFNLEFDMIPRLFSSDALSSEHRAPGKSLLINQECGENLVRIGTNFKIVEEFASAKLVTITEGT